MFLSEEAYHDMTFAVENLCTLAAKTTCKDRWRQILNEADRLRDENKYLYTIQQRISSTQMDEIQAEKVILAVCATLLAVLMSTSFVFADGLKLVGSYPENGQHDLQPMNVAVKLRFNHNMVGKEAQKANKGKIHLLDKKGKSIKIMTLYSEKNPKEIWVYVQKDLKSKGKYKLEISKNLQATDGQTLGENTTVKFGIMDM